MKKLILSIATLLLFGMPLFGASDSFITLVKGKKKFPKKTVVSTPAPTKYEKLYKDKNVISAQGEFVTLKLVGQKLYAELPLTSLDRDILFGVTAGASSVGDLCHAGAREADPQLIKFSRRDSSILMHLTPTQVEVDGKSPRTDALRDQNFGAPAKAKFNILAYTPDSCAVVIELSDLFLKIDKSMNPFPAKSSGSDIEFTPDTKKTGITQIKAADDNISVKVNYSGLFKATGGGWDAPGAKNFTADALFSMVLLPREPMRSRISDVRIGAFLSQKTMVSNRNDNLEDYTVARRWNLIPKDSAAYMRGELSDPVKPILFYVDTLFPALWREPIKNGVLLWNDALRKAGFSNAIEVRDYPTDDDQFDADNLRYSCIRYIPTPVENAMGPSWCDERTGEVISASVYIYNNISKLIEDWRFIQTSAVDTLIRSGKLPQSHIEETIAYITAHEVGHCLGLMHNMGASSSFPVDSLRSATFTQKYGTAPSIMDYARFNYVAQVGDKGVRLTPAELGVYDYYAIEWLYRWYPTGQDQERELEKMVDAAQKEPMLRYGRQQVMSRYDPTAFEEDLGDDPMKASDYGITNLKYILANMDQWLGSGEQSAERKNDLYAQLVRQYYRYIRNVVYNVGGIKLTDVGVRQDGRRFESIDRDVQKRSMLWTIEEMKNCDWIESGDVVEKLDIDRLNSDMVVELLSDMFYNNSLRVVLSEQLSENPYTLEEYLDDLYTNLWEPYVGRGELPEAVAIFQKVTPRLSYEALKKLKVFSISESQQSYARELNHGDLAPSALEQEYGFVNYTCNCHNDPTATSLGSGYNWQRSVNITAISQSYAQYLAFAQRIKELIEERSAAIDQSQRAHYNSIIFSLGRITRDRDAIKNMFQYEN
ncbi:MAG: zinc-dependent metalloprotease [Rikenellaceae bacterium]